MTPALLLTLVLAAPTMSKHPKTEPTERPAAKTPEEAHERARELLANIDRRVYDADWTALGVSVIPYLERVADDTSALSPPRARALGGLSVLAPAEAQSRAHRLSRDENAPFVLRDASVATLEKTVPAEKLAQELTPVMKEAKSIELRARAAEALSRSSTQNCAAVKTQLTHEDNARLALFRGAMTRCGAAK